MHCSWKHRNHLCRGWFVDPNRRGTRKENTVEIAGVTWNWMPTNMLINLLNDPPIGWLNKSPHLEEEWDFKWVVDSKGVCDCDCDSRPATKLNCQSPSLLYGWSKMRSAQKLEPFLPPPVLCLSLNRGDDWIVSRYVGQLCKELRGQSLETFIIYIIITRKIMKLSWN